MSQPDKEWRYEGLLGKILFAVDMREQGHGEDDIDRMWQERFIPAETPNSNVVYVDFSQSERH
jgi:hypothetical protein